MKTKTNGRQLPIVVTKFERLGERFGYCDNVEGFFIDDPNFLFEVYLDDVQSETTYKETRISELYIKYGEGESSTIQWSWDTGNGEEPDWEYGKRLLTDLLSGIEPAIRNQVSNNTEYCIIRFDRLINQLIKSGIEHAVVISAVEESLNRAKNINTDC